LKRTAGRPHVEAARHSGYLKWSGRAPGYPCGARLLALAQERGRLTAELGELYLIPFLQRPHSLLLEAWRVRLISSRMGDELEVTAQGRLDQCYVTQTVQVIHGALSPSSGRR